jgi:hypothetical protein
VSSPVHLYK